MALDVVLHGSIAVGACLFLARTTTIDVSSSSEPTPAAHRRAGA
jgi:hypothetical protein